jgi:hypothetical protein
MEGVRRSPALQKLQNTLRPKRNDFREEVFKDTQWRDFIYFGLPEEKTSPDHLKNHKIRSILHVHAIVLRYTCLQQIAGPISHRQRHEPRGRTPFPT